MKRLFALALLATILTQLPGAADAQVTASGRITLLRVHDVGTRFGPPADQIDVEVVVMVDTQPGKAFGFQLRADGQMAARQAMLDLLRDAFERNLAVNFDHITPAGKNNGRIMRVWLRR